MSANGCDESRAAVWQASLIEAGLLFEEIIRWLTVCVGIVFYVGQNIEGVLLEEGREVHSSSCSFLIVEKVLVEAFTIFVGIRALGLLVLSTSRILSLDILIYVFFVLRGVVSSFGEVWFGFLVSVRFLVWEITRRSLWTEIDFVYWEDSCLTRLPEELLFTAAISSSYGVAGRIVVLDRGIRFQVRGEESPSFLPWFEWHHSSLSLFLCYLGLGSTPHPAPHSRFGKDPPSFFVSLFCVPWISELFVLTTRVGRENSQRGNLQIAS